MCIYIDLCTPDSVCQILRTYFIDEMKWYICMYVCTRMISKEMHTLATLRK